MEKKNIETKALLFPMESFENKRNIDYIQMFLYLYKRFEVFVFTVVNIISQIIISNRRTIKR